MPIYRYTAKKGPEEIVKGTIEGSCEREVIEKLSQAGYLPINLEEETTRSKTEDITKSNSSQKVKSKYITIFTRQLAILLKSGMPILDALMTIYEQTQNPTLKNIIMAIYEDIKAGVSFSAAILKYPNVFSSLYIAMVKAGEDSGTLYQTLLQIAEYRTKQEELLSKIKIALSYPLLMLFVSVGTIIFMFTFVMPKLLKLYWSYQNLPLPTKILIAIIDIFKNNGKWIIIFLLLILFILMRFFTTKQGRFFLDKYKLKIPFLGTFFLKTELQRFSLTLSILIKAGIPIIKAIDIAIPIVKNELIRIYLEKSSKHLEEGGSFGKSLKESKIFPLFMSNLIITGESAGRLIDVLGEISSAYEKDIDEMLKLFMVLLEPILILFMGLIVGFIVLAMLLPIFEINVGI